VVGGEIENPEKSSRGKRARREKKREKASGHVLKDEITKSTDLTVLPAFGSQARQSVPTGTNPMKLLASKRAISWADVAKRQRDDSDHSFHEILSLTIELNDW
jgi:hypothetical protein